MGGSSIDRATSEGRPQAASPPIRDALPADAAAIAAIGTVGFSRIHEPLMGVVPTRAAVEQSYSHDAVVDSITRCAGADDAHFLVAERDGRVVGFLHYDCFTSEPELHRIYLDDEEIGRGTGSALMDELHARLGEQASYVLLVVLANEPARQFYARHGLVEERRLPDGRVFYRGSMDLDLPPGGEPVPAVVLRRMVGASHPSTAD
jgi:GNAT superfamily N-acetyltransferase